MNIFIGGLSYKDTKEDIQNLFSPHGKVSSIKMIYDKTTGVFKGYAFVHMLDEAEGTAAIEDLDKMEFEGRKLTVSKAKNQNKPEKDKVIDSKDSKFTVSFDLG